MHISTVFLKEGKQKIPLIVYFLLKIPSRGAICYERLNKKFLLAFLESGTVLNEEKMMGKATSKDDGQRISDAWNSYTGAWLRMKSNKL